MPITSWLLWALAVLAGLVALDRVFLYLERRGWLYYRKRKPNPASVGSALLDIHAMLEPGKKHVVEIRRAAPKAEADGGGAPPGEPPVASTRDDPERR